MARRRASFVLLFGICPISFGIAHIIDMPGLLGWIPGWLPPTRMFWAYATTMGFFGAAVALLTGIMAPLAARLLTAEIVIFESGLDSEALRRATHSLHLGGQRHLPRIGRRQLGRVRLHRRGGRNQTSPRRSSRRSKHPGLRFADWYQLPLIIYGTQASDRSLPPLQRSSERPSSHFRLRTDSSHLSMTLRS